MKRRGLTGLTFVASLLAPAILALLIRSYITNDTVAWAVGGQMIIVDSIRGEMSIWTGRVHRAMSGARLDSVDASEGLSARQVIERSGPAGARFFAGFGVISSDHYPDGYRPRQGSVTAVVLPYWFLLVISAALPIRGLVRRPVLEPVPGDLGRCRHCGSDRVDQRPICHVCHLPADAPIDPRPDPAAIKGVGAAANEPAGGPGRG